MELPSEVEPKHQKYAKIRYVGQAVAWGVEALKGEYHGDENGMAQPLISVTIAFSGGQEK